MSRNRGGLTAASLLFCLGVSASSARAGLSAGEVYTVRLAVSRTGFEPRRVSVPLGAVRVVVTARDGDHCFAIPSLDIEKRVRPARALEVDVNFERTGEYPFRCCVEDADSVETGVLVVTAGK